jgi:hypothetical protein
MSHYQKYNKNNIILDYRNKKYINKKIKGGWGGRTTPVGVGGGFSHPRPLIWGGQSHPMALGVVRPPPRARSKKNKKK